MTLAKLDNLDLHTWCFKEIRPPVDEVVETDGEDEVVEAKEGEEH